MKADYISHMGNDLTVVNAARVSFDKQSSFDQVGEVLTDGTLKATEDVLQSSDDSLIHYLSRNGHWTPFSHPQVSIRETVPIFVARQRFKHMIGFTYNEVSRRYVDDTPEFYTPNTWRSRPEGSIKQGSGETPITQAVWESNYSELLIEVEKLYNSMIINGVAPEQARMVLPQSMYTSYWVTGSLAAWARAYKQRIDPHAQIEIQHLAKQWNEIIAPLYPVSWAALTQGEY